jgi:hypothetical protein
MEFVMIDQQTINRVIHQKNKDLYKKVDVFQLQHEIKEKQNKNKKLKQTIKIMIVSFVFLATVMVANLGSLSEWQKKQMKWFHQYPSIFEHPFTIK